jgi:hypothetical protein
MIWVRTVVKSARAGRHGVLPVTSVGCASRRTDASRPAVEAYAISGP